MQKLVIDTNVFVSSLIQKNYPYFIINNLFLEDRIQLCVSNALLSEYYEVLNRPKFTKFRDFFVRAESLLSDIETKASMFLPKNSIDLISDKDDNMILELADECKADFIVTGNTNDFTFSTFKETKILTPREYWEFYQPK